MKYIDTQPPVLELTRRNLQALLDKLDDPNSARTLIDPDGRIAVRAVENSEHYHSRPAGPTLTNGVYDDGTPTKEKTRDQPQ